MGVCVVVGEEDPPFPAALKVGEDRKQCKVLSFQTLPPLPDISSFFPPGSSLSSPFKEEVTPFAR